MSSFPMIIEVAKELKLIHEVEDLPSGVPFLVLERGVTENEFRIAKRFTQRGRQEVQELYDELF